MAILHANRAINYEISDCLYNIIDVKIPPFGGDPMLISPRKLNVYWSSRIATPNDSNLNAFHTTESI